MQTCIADAQLFINPGNTLNINTGSMCFVNTGINNNGTISGGGTLVLSGNNVITITGNGIINNLVLDNSAGATIASGMQNITGVFTPVAGTLTTNGNLTLASSISGSASIAQGSGAYLSGNVKVQRYVGSNLQWRMIGFPFTASTTIAENTLADFYSSGYNAYTYNEGIDDQTNYGNSGTANAGWVQFSGGTINANQGLLLSGGTVSSTINFTGPVNTGTQSIALTKDKNGWNFIANPFASDINWTSINANNTALVNNAVYRYDPNTSAYATYVNGSSTGHQNNIIENGAGFFVQAKTAGNLSIAETDKTSNAPSASLMGFETTAKSIIKLSLSKQVDSYADEVVLRWGVDPATDSFDGAYDAYDMGRSVGPDISVIGNDKTVYSVFHGTALKNNKDENRTVQLGIKNMQEGNYQIGMQLLSAIANGNKVFLHDHYTHQYVLIDGATDHYNFITSTDISSQANSRFSIVLNYKEPDHNNNNSDLPVILLNNPSSGNHFILFSKNNYSQLHWQIVDQSGKLLQAGLISNVIKGSSHRINAGNTTQGSYFIKLDGDGSTLPVLKAIKN